MSLASEKQRKPKRKKQKQYNIVGAEVLPATKKYFGKYDYAIAFDGDKFWHDIASHDEISLFIKVCCEPGSYLDSWPNQRRLYLNDIDIVQKAVDYFQEKITEISGPTSDVHVKALADRKRNEVVRDSYFFNKYDVRIVLIDNLSAYQSPIFDPEPAWFKKVHKWLESQSMDYHYGVNRLNTSNRVKLYLKSEEYEDIEMFFLIEFGEYDITDTRVVKI